MQQAVILAGGKGTRLLQRLHGRPKPLVDVDGEPLLGRQIRALKSSGISNILLLVNHAADQIQKFCATSAYADLEINFINEGEPRGTAGALVSAYDHLAERFLVVYGDTLFDVDIPHFWRVHMSAGADATLLLHPNDHPFDSDLIELGVNGRIIGFHSPPHAECALLPNLVNAAMYIIEREAISFWRSVHGATDVARDLFPAMLRRGAYMQGHVSFEYIKDIGTPDRLDRAIRHLRTGVVARARRDQPQKAVFLDRDGTINEIHGHLARAEDFALIDGVAEAVKRLNDTEYRVVVVTNQPVLARGETTFAEMRRIQNKMQTLLGRSGAFLDAIYICPHHPDAGFAGEVAELKKRCDCRKPGTALITRACTDLHIDMSQSWLIGDTTSDILTAQRAGLASILVKTGEGGKDAKYPVLPDFVAKDLGAAVTFLALDFPQLVNAVNPIAGGIAAGNIILIGGLARQGKSTIASVLRYILVRAGIDTHVITLDEFLFSHDPRGSSAPGRYGLVSIQRQLQAWRDGHGEFDIGVPNHARMARHRRLETKLHLRPQSTLIIEGVPALLLDFHTDRRVVRLFVDGDESRRKYRVISDLVARGASNHEAILSYLGRRKFECSAVAASANSADVILMSDVLFSGR